MEIKYSIAKHLGVISEGDKGWKKELNLVSWNDGEPKYDVRDWNESHERMGKGTTFTVSELENLKALLNKLDI
ncbi:MAG: PC4/YdbC family ssDNA-binding protein [Clostridia bacterium]|nr:PC4/YdbC family ssDNA-binding protein [Clostridia bacterium]